MIKINYSHGIADLLELFVLLHVIIVVFLLLLSRQSIIDHLLLTKFLAL